ncbi:MAG: NAD(P)/FAD-dependent oxidoreductase [Mycobacteriales bacterium]
MEPARYAEHGIVVVGAGLAGVRTGQELRARGYDDRLTIIGAETFPSYDRPPLSKGVLLAADGIEPTLPALDVDLAGLGARVHRGERAVGLRPGVLSTTAGEIAYDGLVLACGARPRTVPGAGARTLRTWDDAVRLRALLRAGAHVVIIGAGWIGAEVATAALAHGSAVTVLESAATPVPALGYAVGHRLAGRFARAGADLRTGALVSGTRAGRVLLEDGRSIDADVVLTAIGVRADTDWLRGSGIALAADAGGGVAVDEALRTGWPGVVAAGDCAARWSSRYGTRIRTEHWDDALHAPAVAAASLLGEPATYDPVPYVWSEQFGGYVQCQGHFAGEPDSWREDGDTWAAGWTAADGTLTGLVALDRPRDAVQAGKAIAAGAVLDREAFADPSVPLRRAVRSVR